MSAKRISVESVRNSPESIQLMVVAWDEQEVEGKAQEVPLGEKSLTFPAGTKPRDMLEKIREAGEQIREAAAQAKEIREELNKELRNQGKKEE